MLLFLLHHRQTHSIQSLHQVQNIRKVPAGNLIKEIPHSQVYPMCVEEILSGWRFAAAFAKGTN